MIPRSPMFRSCLLGLASLTLTACQNETLDAAAVARGKDLSSSCTACHQLTTATHQIGPGLKGILGRVAGTQDGFDYSAGMKASGLVWTEENLIAFLQDPFSLIPDTRMGIGELSQQEAADLVTYLRSLN